MRKITSTDKLYISESTIPGSGRGVFANTDISKGQIIETCPYLEIPETEIESTAAGYLHNYIYFFGPDKERALLALGFGSIYNHTYTPNAIYKIKPKQKIIEFISVQDIPKDTEITVNYIQNSPASGPLWFEM